MNGRIVMEVVEDNRVVVFVRNMEPYDSIRVLVATALSLLEGRADVTFNDGSPLTEEEEQEIIDSLVGGSIPSTGGGQRDN
jgi:hypothetical protein